MRLDVADRTQAVVVAFERGLARPSGFCTIGHVPSGQNRCLEDACLQPANLCPLALTPSGGRTSANANGEQCAKIIPPTAMPGTTFPTTTRAAGRTAGAKTDWREFAIRSRGCALRSPCGKARTQF